MTTAAAKTGLLNKRILLIVAGGIAAAKAPDLVRKLKTRGADVTCVLTRAGGEFTTPMTLAALSGNRVYQDLFSLTDEHEMGHIRLARETDVILVAPATADLMARTAQGRADDLAAALLLATETPVILAPAMNPAMWSNAATEENVATLQRRGVRLIGPEAGEMACGEEGVGRMTEPADIAEALDQFFRDRALLAGRRALVTAGPTHEPIDPVRYIANRSSGKQGFAIAAALAGFGADTTLVAGPVALPTPAGVSRIDVETARDMLAACETVLNENAPLDVAVMTAAVADWRTTDAPATKIKKTGTLPGLRLAENPDILKTIAHAANRRPRLVVGFAAETDDVLANATRKRAAKGCDWILANDVAPGTATFGGDMTAIHRITRDGADDWGPMSKRAAADKLARAIAETLAA